MVHPELQQHIGEERRRHEQGVFTGERVEAPSQIDQIQGRLLRLRATNHTTHETKSTSTNTKFKPRRTTYFAQRTFECFHLLKHGKLNMLPTIAASVDRHQGPLLPEYTKVSIPGR